MALRPHNFDTVLKGFSLMAANPLCIEFHHIFVGSPTKIISGNIVTVFLKCLHLIHVTFTLCIIIHRNRIISRWEKWNVQINQHNKSNISHFWVNCLGLSTESEYSLAAASGYMDLRFCKYTASKQFHADCISTSPCLRLQWYCSYFIVSSCCQ